MSAKSICDMGLTQTSEFVASLGRAGFTANLAQQIITAPDNALAKTMYAALSGATTLDSRFALVTTFDITVPADYVHATQLATFKKEYAKQCYFYNEAITDANFAKATTKLTPGRKFKVKVFKQAVAGTTTSEELMAFLRSQKAIFTGAQGASLVFAQKRQELPKGYWYCSFDEKEALFEDAGGYRGVPRVSADSDGDFDFYLGYFEGPWHDGPCLLCFCDE